jgi:hypothetical protein
MRCSLRASTNGMHLVAGDLNLHGDQLAQDVDPDALSFQADLHFWFGYKKAWHSG